MCHIYFLIYGKVTIVMITIHNRDDNNSQLWWLVKTGGYVPPLFYRKFFFNKPYRICGPGPHSFFAKFFLSTRWTKINFAKLSYQEPGDTQGKLSSSPRTRSKEFSRPRKNGREILVEIFREFFRELEGPGILHKIISFANFCIPINTDFA